MSNKEVTTITGKKELKINCRKIENEYYLIGDRKIKDSGDCYPINGRYYKNNTNYIIYDHLHKRYEINNVNYVKGVVNIINKDKLEIGYFLNNDLMTTLRDVKTNFVYVVMNYSLLDDTNYVLNKTSNIYCHYSKLTPLNILNYKKIDYGYKQSLNYNITPETIKLVKDRYLNNLQYLKKYNFSYGIKEYLNGLSFGAEFETSKGVIPKEYCLANALVPLRDGSIKGLEYVTLPLEGEKGINSLINSSKLINEYTSYDDTCSFHLHLGNVPRTESFITALFKLSLFIQDDIFKMFPLYKKDNRGYKRKNYTAPLPTVELLSKLDNKITPYNLKSNFSKIFNYLSDGRDYNEYNKELNSVTSHPNDPNNTRKWNIRSRYHWINFVPLLFGNKQTIEFRIHTPIKDPNKIISFLLFCSKLINFTKQNEDLILSSDNTEYFDLLNIFNSKTSNYKGSRRLDSEVINYYTHRKNATKLFSKNNNYNYDEKKFLYDPKIDFNYEYNTYFLSKEHYEEKEKLKKTLDSKLEASRTVNSWYNNEEVSDRASAEMRAINERINQSSGPALTVPPSFHTFRDE
jgi:hypothetical protein